MDNDLMFWVEWVKMTEEQRINLLPHIHDNNILAEMAANITPKDANARIVGCTAIYLIDDNEVLLDVASRIHADSLLIDIASKLKTTELLRRFFDIENVITCMTFSSDLLDSLLRCVDDIDELINHYSNHTSFAIRRGVFDIIMGYLAESEGAEYSRYLKVLQDMAIIEPYIMSREYMCHKLDRITEDSI